MKQITLDDIINDKKLSTYLLAGNDHLEAMGFTEHGRRHAKLTSLLAARILRDLGYSERQAELAAIAGYLHDIGNVVSRHNHGQTAAMIVMLSLEELGMDFAEISLVVSAIGNHEEQYGYPVNSVAAALILADKSDVHRSRVRNRDVATFDIHDRVNYAANKSEVIVDTEQRIITLRLDIDNEISSVMDYFEIFLTRMVMCRRAAEHLKSQFSIIINNSKLL